MQLVQDPATKADAQQFWQLPGRELDRLLASTRHADRVELKLVVPANAHEATCTSLGVDFSRASARKVYFLDTADLKLKRHGVVARIRSVEDRADDSVVKLRPCAADDLPARLRRSKRFGVEVDAMPGQFVCTGAIARRLGKNDVRKAVRGERPLRALFSKEQLALLPGRTRIGDLSIFGPVDVRREKILPQGADFRLAVERWTYPDGSSILELSTRCAARAAVPVAAQLASVLRAYEIDLTGEQQTKTHTTLSYFHCAG
ncbi:hypothetical protein AB0C29_16095 [Actinoplanes sp. NPDC048791]|uniref:hypothetical protein n=1 Tax=Actinoplanes sp. NPDC048791 TaxID=3154623 RepID=UPI0033DE87BE